MPSTENHIKSDDIGEALANAVFAVGRAAGLLLAQACQVAIEKREGGERS